MMLNKGISRAARLLCGVSLVTAGTALAQQAQTDAPMAAAPEPQDEEIVVVGSQIRGSRVTDVLPVTVLESTDIDAVAASSGDDLFRAIPQAGDVAFNESRDAGGINDARGDTASINLRGLGTGNTLVLLNGRRLVLHPGTQSENLVPVQSVNTNTIPVRGVRRIEVLRDGAAAIYGTDAVAGVVNTVLKTRFDGLTIDGEFSMTEDSEQNEREISFEAGKTFNGGRTNISVFGTYNHRDPLFARDRWNSLSSDLRPLVADTPFANDTDFDNRSNDTIWAEFQRLTNSYAASTTTASYNGTALTSSGIFHVQPATNEGCIAPAGPGVCFDNSSLSTASTDNNLRYNTNDVRTIQGRNERFNVFGYLNHEFSDRLEFFAEAGYYRGDFDGVREQDTSLANQRVIVPITAYWNPFGPVGSPNRLPGLTGVATTGVPLELIDYRPVDAGPIRINVLNETTRFLGGFRGTLAGFDWETAGLYSRARTKDTMRTISLTLFQQAIARTDSTAYNPFNGGDPLNPGRADSSPNPQSVIDSFMVDIYRLSITDMAMWDFKLSKPDLFTLPAGDVGMATGLEYRRETYTEDRDPRLDGTIRFVALDGSGNGSDTLGASPTPDSGGSREVKSAFAELAVPLVSSDMNVPLIHSLNLQLAGRVEDYTAFGTVAKPKVAASWFPMRGLQFRGAWSQGFRAPNLPQQFERGIQRSNTRTDWIKCEADERRGLIANFDACTRSQGVVSNRSGSETLQPEESDNLNFGATLQAPIPRRLGRLTLTADFWQIKQRNLIGLFGDSNALTLDYLLRLNGSSNPNVQRAAPTQAEIDAFAGTGLDPVGRVIQVIDNYNNLSPRTVRGLDLALYYEINDTPLGDFDVKLNAAHLFKFYQEPDALRQSLIDAQENGTIDPTITIAGAQDLLEQDGRPKWRGSATVTWRLGKLGLGYFGSYVGPVNDLGAALADGTTWRVDEHVTHSIYGQVSFGKKDNAGPMANTRIRFGIRNLTNNLAPLADNPFGYIGDLYGNRGRQFYVSARKAF
ncbi:TonB-dependent receptor [Sphingomonas sp.]|jgi:iron complex outermembrane recepter protein|uniref:TonB-dependent receptor domain-containing protein n=1 Tax=Sphingomonas sp. TaxID=28214 RepID=UPI001821A05C|nr:TonB-dependent receptor [Sphingomonas sp.]MBA4761185.1 TonB-dependent receptor [Sphingomonas sp.]